MNKIVKIILIVLLLIVAICVIRNHTTNVFFLTTPSFIQHKVSKEELQYVQDLAKINNLDLDRCGFTEYILNPTGTILVKCQLYYKGFPVFTDIVNISFTKEGKLSLVPGLEDYFWEKLNPAIDVKENATISAIEAKRIFANMMNAGRLSVVVSTAEFGVYNTDINSEESGYLYVWKVNGFGGEAVIDATSGEVVYFFNGIIID